MRDLQARDWFLITVVSSSVFGRWGGGRYGERRGGGCHGKGSEVSRGLGLNLSYKVMIQKITLIIKFYFVMLKLEDVARLFNKQNLKGSYSFLHVNNY